MNRTINWLFRAFVVWSVLSESWRLFRAKNPIWTGIGDLFWFVVWGLFVVLGGLVGVSAIWIIAEMRDGHRISLSRWWDGLLELLARESD